MSEGKGLAVVERSVELGIRLGIRAGDSEG
jgi:hypothetical protein